MNEESSKKKYNLRYSILCDDIRHEVGNKISLMGIYSDNISISALPFLFPKLCFHLVFDIFEPGRKLTIKIMSPNNQELLLGGGPITIEKPRNDNDNVAKYCILDVMFGNLNISKEGLYRLVCIFDDNEELKQEIEFNVKIADQKL